MVGFEYHYNTPSEIMEQILFLSEANIEHYAIIIFMVILYICLVYYVIPYFNIAREYATKEKKKRARKIFINKIAMQKDLEEEIERELQI